MTDPFTIKDYYNFKFLQGVDVSSSGKVAYVVASFVKKDEDNQDDLLARIHEEQSHIWIINDSEDHIQLTTSGKEQSPSWSPDATKLIYSSKKADKPQLYLLNMYGGEPIELTTLENGVGGKVSWISNNEILFCAGKDEKLPEAADPYRVTRDFFRMDMVGLVQRTLHDVYRLNLETKQLTQVTSNTMHHIGIELSPDKSKAIVPTMYEEEAVMGIYPRLYLLDLKTKHLEKLTDLAMVAVTWTDNDTVAFVGVDLDAKIGSLNHIYQLDITTKQVNNLTEGDIYGAGGGLQTDMPTIGARTPNLVYHQQYLYYNVQIGGNIEIRRIHLETKTIEVIVKENSNYLATIQHDSLYFTRSTPHNPLDIYSLQLPSGEEMELTALNKSILEQRHKHEVKHFTAKGVDGKDVEAWIWLPEGSTAPLPTLLNIHGGPHSGWGNVFQFENLYLLGAGYAILMANHRGSTGYGQEFSSMLVGDWGNHDYHDLMAAVDQAIDMELTDKDKLGCFGISGGGNLSSWIVGQTRRFKAAIPENPVTNWTSFFGTSDIGRWFGRAEMGGLPWEIPEVYRKSSPITYAHTCTTPTLMIQHEGDLRCPAEQSDQFYNTLKEAGCVVEMQRMPGTPHAGSLVGPLIIREIQNRAILDWFTKFISTS